MFSASNRFTGALNITPPTSGSMVFNYGSNRPAGYAKLTGAAIGPVVANGRFDMLSAASIGTISGTGTTGWLTSSSTANNVLTFQAGQPFGMFYFGVDANEATLQETGTGNVTFAYFGYSPTNNTPNASIVFNGGNWYIGQTGQNNSNAQMTGTATLTDGAFVAQTTQRVLPRQLGREQRNAIDGGWLGAASRRQGCKPFVFVANGAPPPACSQSRTAVSPSGTTMGAS